MAAIYSNGSNRWNILGFNFTKRDALSSVYKISMFTMQLEMYLAVLWLVLCLLSWKCEVHFTIGSRFTFPHMQQTVF
jgi:hypothetical protein